MLTKNEIKELIIKVTNDHIKDDEQAEKHFNAILEIVKKHDGNPIDERFLADVKKIYPNSFYSSPCDSMVYLKLRDTENKDLSDLGLFTSLNGVKKISVSEFKRLNTFAQEKVHNRIEKNNTFLASAAVDRIAKEKEKLLHAQAILEEYSYYDIPSLFSIGREIGYTIEKDS